MNKHTPGPWVIETTETDNIILQGEDSDQIAICDRAFGDANARLIAAAPELLATLEWCLQRFESLNKSSQHNNYEINILKRAIAKVR